MKKKILIVGGIIVAFIFFMWNFGLEIGNVRIGKQFDLKTPQSAEFEKSAFAEKYYSSEDLTVLNIWATWCKPCIEEMPELNAVKKEYENEDVHFIALSVDKDSVKFDDFLKTKKFDFTDITMEDLSYRRAILNKLEGRPTDKHIYSYTAPITYLIKDEKVLTKMEGSTDFEELKSLIEKHQKE